MHSSKPLHTSPALKSASWLLRPAALAPSWVSLFVLQDVYDKKRQGLIKQLKADALAWTSKYARGGSVRAQSAREV